ncbi:MAG: TRAP transporter substrate-binding protein DctP [Gammaproteobacteria bacterium]
MKTLLSAVALIAMSLFSANVAAQTKTFKIATLAPEGSDWMNQMKAGAKEIAKQTDGRVKFKFYGGGVMGNDKKVMRKMRNGQLHGGAFTAGSLAERFPGMNLYGMPLVFNDMAEANFVRSSMDGYIKQGLLDSGLVSFGLATGGFAQIMSNYPVKNIDDLKGKRVWVPEGDVISYAAMERFGLSPVTLPTTDVLTGLQTGLIDVIGSSAIGALVLQWHTKVSHISTMPLSYLFAVMVVEDKHFKKLSPSDQKIVSDVFEKVYANFDKQNEPDNAKAMEALLGSGLTLVEPEPGLLDELKNGSRELWRDMAKTKVIPADKLQELETLLETHRSRASAATK